MALESFMSRALPLLVLSTVLAACAGRKPDWNAAASAPVASRSASDEAPLDADAKGDALWAERTEAQNVRDAIAQWEGVAAAEPNNGPVLVKLAHAYYFLADGYLRNDDDAYLQALDDGVRWGERAMIASSPEFAAAMAEGTKYPDAIAQVGPDGVPAMFWYATALGKWAKKQGLPVMLRHKQNIKVTMERVLNLDPEFLGGAPHTYFGVYYAVAPPIAGGDFDKSRQHFESALAISPNVLSTKVLWAAELAVRQQDTPTFDRLLTEVLETDENVVPRIVAENRVEQQKARELQARRDELF